MGGTAAPSRRFFYGWLIVAVAFGVILIGAGTRSAPGALLLGIEADTGWTKAQISLAGAAGLLLLGLGGPVSGVLIDRFGVRSVAMVDRIIGCPHEEGVDYPEGEECPECPFWRGKDRFDHAVPE
jgi:MFS family permease